MNKSVLITATHDDLLELISRKDAVHFKKQLNKNSWDALILGAGALVYAIAFSLPFYAFNPLYGG